MNTPTTHAITIPDQSAALATEAEQGLALITFFQNLPVTTQDELTTANGYLVQIVKLKDAKNAEMHKGTDPLRALDQLIRGWFRPVLDACGRAEAVLKGKIADYTRIQIAERAATLQTAAAAHVAGDHQRTADALNTALAIPTAPPQGTSVRERWVAEVIAANLVPYEWCTPDEKRIKKHASGFAADRTPTPIPGVKFTLEPIVAVRRGK